MRFNASYGSAVKVITIATFSILAFLNALFLALCLRKVVPIYPFLFMLTFSTAFMALGYAFSPRCYELTKSELVVKRALRCVRIPYHKVVEVKPLSSLSLKHIRLFGMGGLFGFYGLYYVSGLGKLWLYITKWKNLVLVKAVDKSYVLSPDDREGFIKALSDVLTHR